MAVLMEVEYRKKEVEILFNSILIILHLQSWI